MTGSATEGTRAAGRGDEADQPCLRIDGEVFELLSDGPLLDVDCPVRLARLFDT